MARKLLASTPILVAALLHGEVSLAALHVAESPLCSVALTKVSYDDPDVDDSEFLELAIERRDESSLPNPPSRPAPAAPAVHDAAPPCMSDTGVPEASSGSVPESGTTSARLTLADCGLSVLELMSGGGAECEAYRSLPLGDVPVPDDGFLVICASDSGLAALGLCTVTAAGRSALRNGWIQNGPKDGLRFTRTDGTAVELSYEGRLSCFSDSAMALADESGVTSNANHEEEDDVGTLCDDRYVLLPISEAELRAANECPRGVLPEDGGPSGNDAANGTGPDGTIPPAPGAPWTPEFAPPAPGSSGPTPTASGPVYLDAGAFELPLRESSPPPPPGCAVAPHTKAIRFGMPLLGLLLAGAAGRRRVTRPRPRR